MPSGQQSVVDIIALCQSESDLHLHDYIGNSLMQHELIQFQEEFFNGTKADGFVTGGVELVTDFVD